MWMAFRNLVRQLKHLEGPSLLGRGEMVYMVCPAAHWHARATAPH